MSLPENSPLGKNSSYRSSYSPDLLFPIARSVKRAEIGVDPIALPFFGRDIWNAYELSWLNERGKPVVALGEFSVPAESPCLIESKSLKLYLNSLNQTRFQDVASVQDCIARDLSQASGARVNVRLVTLEHQPLREIRYPRGICLDHLDIEINQYSPVPDLLSSEASRGVQDEVLYSHLLKSNCLVTGQPDWGMVVVRYSGPAIDKEGLLRYFISFREHNEFHEQCVERIYMDILHWCSPSELSVWARYTRRGGLDINPFRSSSSVYDPGNLSEVRQ